MRRLSVAALALGLCSLARADVATLADVKAQHGVQLSADELRRFMPGAKVVSRVPVGSSRSWKNNPDGTFLASSDGRGSNGGSNALGKGPGTWRVTDEGKLCVTIKWPRNPDDWCRRIFKVGDKYYGVGGSDDNSVAHEFEFSH